MGPSTNAGKVEIVLTVDGKQYRRDLGTAKAQMDEFGRSGERTALVLSKLKGAVAGAFGAAAAAAVGRGIYNTTKQFESLSAQLLTVERSEARARLSFQRIQEFAARTPFELAEVVEAFIKLKSRGLDPSAEALTAYGNIASSMGKSLDQMVEAVGDAAVGEFERLKEFGIQASSQGNRVTFTFRGVSTTVQKSSAEIEGYLRSLGNIEFAGGMQRQMDTLAGVSSNLSDAIAALSQRVDSGTGFTAAIKAAMKLTTEWANELAGVKRPLADIEADIKALNEALAQMPAGKQGDAFADRQALEQERLDALLKSSSPERIQQGIAELDKRIAAQQNATAKAFEQRAKLDRVGLGFADSFLGSDAAGQQKALSDMQFQRAIAQGRLKNISKADQESAAAAAGAGKSGGASGGRNDGAADRAKARQDALNGSIADELRQRELAIRLIGDESKAARVRAEIDLGYYKEWDAKAREQLVLLAEREDQAEAAFRAEQQRQAAQDRADEERRRRNLSAVDPMRGAATRPVDLAGGLSRARSSREIDGVKNDAIAQAARDRDAVMKAADELANERLLSETEYTEVALNVWRDYERRKTDITRASEQARADVQLAALDGTAAALGDMADLAAMFGEKGFKAYKALAIAQALISAPSSAMKAYERGLEIPIVGPVLAPVMAATALAMQLARVAQIRNAEYQGGREFGGAVRSDAMYKVFERRNGRSQPELFKDNATGDVYLGGADGQVMPAKPHAVSDGGGMSNVRVISDLGFPVQTVPFVTGSELQLRLRYTEQAAVQSSQRALARDQEFGGPLTQQRRAYEGTATRPRRR